MAHSYRNGRLSMAEIKPRVASWLGHAQHAQTKGLVTKLFRQVIFKKG
ncbi:MAG: hypothetical protein HRU06_15670 [Oceanospirillaceae bacterium]|nr:hypothetical protein [Oceanospirillaceae bacterium]